MLFELQCRATPTRESMRPATGVSYSRRTIRHRHRTLEVLLRGHSSSPSHANDSSTAQDALTESSHSWLSMFLRREYSSMRLVLACRLAWCAIASYGNS